MPFLRKPNFTSVKHQNKGPPKSHTCAYINVNRMSKADNSDDDLQAPVPNRRHSSEWKQWVAGIVFSIFIPSYTLKIGTLATLKNNIGTIVVTLETMADVVECTTGVVGMMASMAKKRAKSIQDLPTQAEEKAKQTQELTHQVGTLGNGVEEMMESSSLDVTNNRQETGHEDRLVKRFP